MTLHLQNRTRSAFGIGVVSNPVPCIVSMVILKRACDIWFVGY